MFTGIIEEIGFIKQINTENQSNKIVISANKILSDIKTGDSISINGICLTTVAFNNNTFTVQAVKESIGKSSLSTYQVGQPVNLERSLKLSDRLGGHMVLGHIDGTGKIKNIITSGNSNIFDITYPIELKQYIAGKGSITIDGISLTIMKTKGNIFSISVIPHTYQNTCLLKKQKGNLVNIEVDILARYLETLQQEKTELSKTYLSEKGYL